MFAHNLTKTIVGGRPPRYASAPCKLTISSYLFVRWHLRRVGYLGHQQQVDVLTLKVVPESRMTWSRGLYLCANFSLTRPLCSRVSPMYATDVRQKHRLMPLLSGRCPHNNSTHIIYIYIYIIHIVPPSDELSRLQRTADSQSHHHHHVRLLKSCQNATCTCKEIKIMDKNI